MNISSPNQINPLCIWAVTDNKPGHQNQTKGLIEALSHYREVDVIWKPGVSVTKNIWMLLVNRFKNSNANPEQQLPDLLIGAGHQTHMTLLALKRMVGGRVVIMMSPSLPLKLFDLCFIPRHDKPRKKDNVIETLGPINRLIPASSSFSKREPAQNSRKGLILIGGPSRHYIWDSLFVARHIGSVLAQDADIQWVVAGSRRTPAECYEALKRDFPEIEIVYPDDVSADWLPGKIAESGKIWVTEDSISMVYESLTSGAQTGVIRLTYEKPTRVTKEIDCLIAEGRVHTSTTNMLSQAGNKNPEILYEADRCAKLLLEKFEL